MKKISEKVLNILVIVISLVCTILMIVCSIFLAVKSDKKADVNIISAPVRTAGYLPDYSITMPFYWSVSFYDSYTGETNTGITTFIDYFTFSRSDDSFNFVYTTTKFSDGKFYSENWRQTNNSSSVTSLNEVGLITMYGVIANGDRPNPYEIALSYTMYYRVLAQYYSSVSYVSFTSPITGKKYDTFPEPPINGNLTRTLAGVSFFYSVISASNNSPGSGDVGLPFYLFEFEEGGAFVFILAVNSASENVYLSNYSRRYDGVAPYYVGYNTSFNGTSNYQAGYDQGFNAGQQVGSSSAYSEGYAAGYKTGSSSAETGNFLTLFTTIADSQLVLLKGFLDFEFLGFNMLTFFKGLMTVLICIMVVRLITSGSTSS